MPTEKQRYHTRIAVITVILLVVAYALGAQTLSNNGWEFPDNGFCPSDGKVYASFVECSNALLTQCLKKYEGRTDFNVPVTCRLRCGACVAVESPEQDFRTLSLFASRGLCNEIYSEYALAAIQNNRNQYDIHKAEKFKQHCYYLVENWEMLNDPTRSRDQNWLFWNYHIELQNSVDRWHRAGYSFEQNEHLLKNFWWDLVNNYDSTLNDKIAQGVASRIL